MASANLLGTAWESGAARVLIVVRCHGEVSGWAAAWGSKGHVAVSSELERSGSDSNVEKPVSSRIAPGGSIRKIP